MGGWLRVSEAQKFPETNLPSGRQLPRASTEPTEPSLSVWAYPALVDDTPLLDTPWPPNLDLSTVPFRTRTVTALRRMGFFDDPALFDTLTEAEVLSWWNAGQVTVADIRETGNAAVRRHHERAAYLPELRASMDAVADEPWAKHIWPRDPRFAEYLPPGDATVYDIATGGTLDDQEELWGQLDGLREAVDAQVLLPLPQAVAEYVEAISGQHGDRLDVVLARTGLNGQDPITLMEAARRLGVSNQRISQLDGQLRRHLERARSPAGVWMPQVVVAERAGWPDGYTGRGSGGDEGILLVDRAARHAMR